MKNLMTDSIIRISSAYRDTEKYRYNSAKAEMWEAIKNLEKVIAEIVNNRTDYEDEIEEIFIDDDWGDRD